jgi:hypothetical protein
VGVVRSRGVLQIPQNLLFRTRNTIDTPSSHLNHTYSIIPQPTYILNTMSSPTTTNELSYVFIPNLVGRQMLRIPMLSEPELDLTELDIPEASPSLTLTTTEVKPTSLGGSQRNVSPARSIESVDETE